MGWVDKQANRVENFVKNEVIEPIKDVGSWVDDNVLQPIKDDPIEAIGTAVAYYYGGPIAAGAAKTGFELEEGKSVEDALKAGLTTAAVAEIGSNLTGGPTGAEAGGATGAFDIAGNPDILGGSSAISLGNAAGAFDMGGAPEVMNAPISEATPIPSQNLQYPGIEVQPTYTPVPGSLQEALPDFGIQTQATTPPYTAVPGSLDAAVAGGLLGTAEAAAGTSLTDTLRAANLANNLMNAPQQPVPNPNLQQQAQVPVGGVDYSGLLGLLQQRPMTTGLLGTRFQPQSYNLLSLLG